MAEGLDRLYRNYATASERVEHRVEWLPKTLMFTEREAQQALIETEKAQKPTNAPVAGYLPRRSGRPV